MKTLGILGGLGPESTIDYYRSILAVCRERRPEAGIPEIVINSLDVDKGIAMLNNGRLEELADYLSGGIATLERAGVDFALIAANTPHIVFPEVEKRATVPLLSIVRVTAQKAKALGLKRVALFGTGFTMGASFYPEEFAAIGVELVRPAEEERVFIHEKYLGELLKNQFLPETREGILRIAERMMRQEGAEAVVLAGTELPLLLRGSGEEIRWLDTTVIHVEAAVEELFR